MNSATLSDPNIAELIMGQSPPSSSYNINGDGIPFFQGKTDFGDLYPTVRVFCNAPNKIADPGDILISVRAPVGPTNLNQIRSCIGRGLAAIRCHQDIETNYLLYFLRYYEPCLARIGKGSTFEAIKRDDLEDIRIPLPPIQEQKCIAGILEKADRLRRMRRYALELNNAYLQSVFLEMFGDPGTNQMGWKDSILDEHIKIISGKNFKFEEYSNDGVRLFQIANVTFQETDWNEIAYLPIHYVDDYPKLVLEPGNLLMALNRPILGDKVKFAILSEKDCPAILYQRVGKFIIKSKQIIQPFLYGFMHTRYFYRELKVRLAGSDQPYINPTELVNMRVPIPPLELQEEFGQIVQKFKRIQYQQREAERQAEHLFQTLLHKAFNGELS